MSPGDVLPAIRDAALAKLVAARPGASALVLAADQTPAPDAPSPDALIVAAGGLAPEAWLARGWRPAFAEGAFADQAAAQAAVEALAAADYECFRWETLVVALRRADFDARDLNLYRLLRDQMLAAVALAHMLAGRKPG